MVGLGLKLRRLGIIDLVMSVPTHTKWPNAAALYRPASFESLTRDLVIESFML